MMIGELGCECIMRHQTYKRGRRTRHLRLTQPVNVNLPISPTTAGGGNWTKNAKRTPYMQRGMSGKERGEKEKTGRRGRTGKESRERKLLGHVSP